MVKNSASLSGGSTPSAYSRSSLARYPAPSCLVAICSRGLRIISDMDREFLRESQLELAPSPRQQMYIQNSWRVISSSPRRA